MAIGLERRGLTKDRLADQAQIDPVRLSGPGVSAPRMPPPQEGSATKIANALGKWASEKLVDIASTEQEAALLDGQMAAVQGLTLEQIEMQGADKFALQGFRITTAQTISSSMVAANEQMIEDKDYALDAESYRDKYIAQMAGAIKGQDPRTARLINEQMAAQMPALVAKQTLANTKFLEVQNYDAVKRSIDVMSRDAQGLEALVAITRGGEGTQSGALSPSRLSGAVSEGVVLAFRNDNPRAYHLLKVAGVFDDYSTEELNRIENAKTQYQTRLKGTFNQTRFDRQQALNAEIKTGEVLPPDAVRMQTELNRDFGIDTDDVDSQKAWNAAMDPSRTAALTRVKVIEAARLAKDWPAMAAASMSIITDVESGGDRFALGPVIQAGPMKGLRAQGENQVMQPTLDNPGWGIRPSDGTIDDNARVGRDYWELNLTRSEGDIEAAVIGYHAGPGNMDKWLKGDEERGLAPRDYDILPQTETSLAHWAKVKERLDDAEFPTAAERYNEASHQEAEAKKMFDLAAWELAGPILAGLDEDFREGRVEHDDWLVSRNAVFEEYEVKKTIAMVNYEIQFTKDVLAASAKAVGKQVSAQQHDALVAMMLPLDVALNAVLDDETSTKEQRWKALSIHQLGRMEIVEELNIPLADAKNGASLQKAFTALQNSLESHDKWLKDEATIENAMLTGSVGSNRMSRKMRDSAFDRRTDEFTRKIQDQVATGSIKPEDVSNAMDEATFAMYRDFGLVDIRMRNNENAIALSPYLNEDKRPKAAYSEMVQRYLRFKQVDPVLASTYLSERSRARVEALIKQTGAAGVMAEAQSQLGFPGATREEGNAFVRQEQTQRLINTAIAEKIEHKDTSGLFLGQEAFTGSANVGDSRLTTTSEKKRMWSPETQEGIRVAVESEVFRLFRMNDDISADLLVDMAMENVEAHSALIGGSFVNLQKPNGETVLQTLFGEKANQYNRANVAHLAVVGYLQSAEMQSEFQFLNDFGISERFSSLVQDTLSGAFFGAIGEMGAGLEAREMLEAKARNVRPFKSFTTTDGTLYVRVLLSNGHYSQAIEIDMKRAGEIFMHNNPI